MRVIAPPWSLLRPRKRICREERAGVSRMDGQQEGDKRFTARTVVEPRGVREQQESKRGERKETFCLRSRALSPANDLACTPRRPRVKRAE